MHIKMISSCAGSANPEGSQHMSYQKGLTYPMEQDWQKVIATQLISAGFAEEVDKENVPEAEMAGTLIGSNDLPSEINLAEGLVITLGEVVRKSFDSSGMNEEQWNGLSDEVREQYLNATVATLRSEIGVSGEEEKFGEDEEKDLGDSPKNKAIAKSPKSKGRTGRKK